MRALARVGACCLDGRRAVGKGSQPGGVACRNFSVSIPLGKGGAHRSLLSARTRGGICSVSRAGAQMSLTVTLLLLQALLLVACLHLLAGPKPPPAGAGKPEAVELELTRKVSAGMSKTSHAHCQLGTCSDWSTAVFRITA